MWLTWEVLRCIKVLLHHEWPLKSSSDQTICAFPADCFPMSANPQRLHLNSERTFIHLEALISWSSRGGGGTSAFEHGCALLLTCPSSTYTHIHGIHNNMVWPSSPLVSPLFLMGRKWKKRGFEGMFLVAGMEGNRRQRERWRAHTLALYIVSAQTDVSLSRSCVGLQHWLSKLFLSSAGCT